jgi:hypothetical protein
MKKEEGKKKKGKKEKYITQRHGDHRGHGGN